MIDHRQYFIILILFAMGSSILNTGCDRNASRDPGLLDAETWA